MFKVAISHSLTSHMPEAAAALEANALRQLDGAAPVAALLFSTWGLDYPVLLAQLAQWLPGCPLIQRMNEQARATPLPGERCEAMPRRGEPCQAPAGVNDRCKLHGGKSTGARTPEERRKFTGMSELL